MFDFHKYETYISKEWYDSVISRDTFSGWCQNFNYADPTEDACAMLLMYAFIFYHKNQQKAIIRSIKSKITKKINELYESNHSKRLERNELETVIKKYIGDSVVITVSDPDHASDGAHVVARMWDDNNDIWDSVVEVSRLAKQIEDKKKKHVFFLDDFIGTGSSFCKFMNKPLVLDSDNHETKVQSIMEKYRDSVDFNIVCLCIHEIGMKRILDEFSFNSIYYGDYYDYSYSLINEGSFYYDIPLFGKRKRELVDYITDKQKTLVVNNDYNLNLPVAFSHGCPNNSSALYYSRKNNWHPLVRLAHDNDNW